MAMVSLEISKISTNNKHTFRERTKKKRVKVFVFYVFNGCFRLNRGHARFVVKTDAHGHRQAPCKDQWDCYNG